MYTKKEGVACILPNKLSDVVRFQEKFTDNSNWIDQFCFIIDKTLFILNKTLFFDRIGICMYCR